MDEYIDALGDMTIFCTFCANSGYWQTQIVKGDREKRCLPHIMGFPLYPYVVLVGKRASYVSSCNARQSLFLRSSDSYRSRIWTGKSYFRGVAKHISKTCNMFPFHYNISCHNQIEEVQDSLQFDELPGSRHPCRTACTIAIHVHMYNRPNYGLESSKEHYVTTIVPGLLKRNVLQRAGVKQ